MDQKENGMITMFVDNVLSQLSGFLKSGQEVHFELAIDQAYNDDGSVTPQLAFPYPKHLVHKITFSVEVP